jgi:hypothetical protein
MSRKAAGRAAKAQYDEAEHAFKNGDFRRAAELFETAYKVYPHHSSLWSAAQAWMRADEDVRAANLLERYLREAPANAPDRDRATSAIGELDRKLGRIEIQSNDVTDVKVDGERVDAERLWVVPGEHVATADSHGRPVRKVVSVAAGDRVAVTMELQAPTSIGGEQPTARALKPLPPWVVFVGAGASLAGGGIIAWSGLDTLDKRDAFLKAPTQRTLDDAHSSQTRTNVAVGVTAGVAALTALAAAFFVDWSGSPKTAASASAR